MKSMKVTLWLALAAGLMSLTSCSKDPKNIFVYEWSESKALGNFDAGNIAVSGDGANAYASVSTTSPTVSAHLYHSTDLTDWTELKFDGALDGSGAGKAALTGSNKVVDLTPTKEGVLASVSKYTSTPEEIPGLIYFQGATPAAAWAIDPIHINVAAVPPAPSQFKLRAGVALNGEQEMVVVSIEDSSVNPPVLAGGPFMGTLSASKIDNRMMLNDGTTGLSAIISGSTMANIGQELWFAEKFAGTYGLLRLKTEQVPTANVVKAERPEAKGSFARFGTAGGNENAATAPSQMLVAGDKLYLSFNTASPAVQGQGGVVTCRFDEGSLQNCSNHPSWNKVGVKGLAKGVNNQVWAVTATGLVSINGDGSMGRTWTEHNPDVPSYFGAIDGMPFSRNKMPSDFGYEIQSAAFTKDGHLLVLTVNESTKNAKVLVAKRAPETLKPE